MAKKPEHLQTFKNLDSTKPGKPHFPKDVHYSGPTLPPLKKKEKAKPGPEVYVRIPKGKRGGSVKETEDGSKLFFNKDRLKDADEKTGKDRTVKMLREDYMKKGPGFKKKDVDVVKGTRNVRGMAEEYVEMLKRNSKTRGRCADKRGQTKYGKDLGMEDPYLAEDTKMAKGRGRMSDDKIGKDWLFFNEERLAEADKLEAEKGERPVEDMAKDFQQKAGIKTLGKGRGNAVRGKGQSTRDDSEAREERAAAARVQQQGKSKAEMEKAELIRKKEFLETEKIKKEEYEEEQRRLNQEAIKKQAEIFEQAKESAKNEAIAKEKAEDAAAANADDSKQKTKVAPTRKYYRQDKLPEPHEIGYFVSNKKDDYESMLDEKFPKRKKGKQ